MYTKLTFRSEHNKCGSGWEEGVKMEGGQVGKVGYINSVIYLPMTPVSPIPGPVLRGWGLPLITNSEHGLECQIEEFGINSEGKGALKVVEWEGQNGASRVRCRRLGEPLWLYF